ncbi:MAG: hypothetical protein IPN90_04330 [Elusimicrobia bacterium]|nr:hypothetical protein [Elusimicrobiota bacterium]
MGHLTTEGTSSRTGWVIEGDADRDGVEDVGETWTVEAQRTVSTTENDYVVIGGQALVVRARRRVTRATVMGWRLKTVWRTGITEA